MIELNEKRFKCVSDYDWWGVIDITGEIKGEYGNDCFSTDTVVDLLNGFAEENKELKKQLRREETDKKRLMSYLMRYKGFGFDEIVEDFLDESYYDNWWEDGFYESCWDEYLKEKGFDGCDD